MKVKCDVDWPFDPEACRATPARIEPRPSAAKTPVASRLASRPSPAHQITADTKAGPSVISVCCNRNCPMSKQRQAQNFDQCFSSGSKKASGSSVVLLLQQQKRNEFDYRKLIRTINTDKIYPNLITAFLSYDV